MARSELVCHLPTWSQATPASRSAGLQSLLFVRFFWRTNERTLCNWQNFIDQNQEDFDDISKNETEEILQLLSANSDDLVFKTRINFEYHNK